MRRVGLSFLLSAAIVLVTVGGVYLIRAGEDAPPPTPIVVPVPVEVARIEPRPFTHELGALGTVKARREAAVSAKVSGPLTRVSPAIELGTPVTAGQLLAEIDPTPFSIDVRQREALVARAQARVRSVEVEVRRQENLIQINREKLGLATAERDRLADLLELDLVARQEVERAELAVRRMQEELERAESGLREAEAEHGVAAADAAAAEADLDRARQALTDTQIRAPFAGVISEKLATLGEQVVPGTVLFRLADVATVKVLVRVPADDVELLRPGAIAHLRVGGFDEPFRGEVAHIGPEADTETRTFPVEILVRDAGSRGLRPGMFARVSIPVRSYPAAILVPRASIVGQRGAPAVFVADPEQGIAQRRPVTIARTFGSRHLITQGLEPGDLLIVTGQHLLRDGAPVRVVETRVLGS